MPFGTHICARLNETRTVYCRVSAMYPNDISDLLILERNLIFDITFSLSI